MENKYLQDHMKFLMDKMLEAYIKNQYDEFERLKKQISNLREILNSHDRIILKTQKLETLVDLKL